jgi:hypothetical protein
MVLDNDYAEFTGYANYEEPVEVTAAHEYNHVLQYAYDVTQDAWMYESTATWAEEKVFPADDDYLNYMATWANSPGTPITTPSGSRKYGTAVWNHWLEQRYGADVIERAWQKSPSTGTTSLGFAPDAYDLAIKAEPTGSSFKANFGDFAAATAAWQATDSGFYDGASLPPVHRRSSDFAIGTSRPVTALNHTGYALFDVPDPPYPATPIRLTQSLPAGTTSGPVGTIALVGIHGQNVTKVVARAGNDGNASVVLEDPSQFEQITAVVANADVSKAGFSSGDWQWSRDNQSVSISLTLAPGATGSPLPDEPMTPTPTAAPPGLVCGATSVEYDPAATPTPTPTASATATPSPTPTVTPSVTPTPTVQPPLATSVRLSRSSTRIKSVLRKGVLALFAQANKAGRHAAKATVDTRTAKRLKVGRRTTTAGSGRRTATAPARMRINVKLSRKVRAALKRNRKRAVKVRVTVTFTPADGTRAVRRTITITLRP